MRAKLLLPILIAAWAVAPAPATGPVLRSPVLPEVSKHLEQGREDIRTSTFRMAKAHAQLVLIGAELKVGVKFQNVSASREASYLKILDSAMQEWEKDLDGTIHFVRVPEGQEAGVVVRFRPAVTMKGEQVAGYVNWKRTMETGGDGNVSATFSADLQIRCKNLDGRAMPASAMKHAVLHELGHVLGLDDSPHEGDIMGPLDVDHPVSAPTALEIQTVKSLRLEAQNIIDQAR